MSEFTIDSLKEYFDSLRAADQTAVQAALVSQEKAIVKAEVAAEKRFDLLNELRQGVATKEQIEALEKVVQSIADRVNHEDGKSDGLSTGWGIFLGIAGLASIIIGAIVAFR